MVCWVAERARAARNVDRVVVATDSQQIADAVQERGVEAVMTAAHHTSGTDRVAVLLSVHQTRAQRHVADAEKVLEKAKEEPRAAFGR